MSSSEPKIKTTNHANRELRINMNRVAPVDNFLIYKNIIRLDRPN
ncbi:MAG: hypothetical protein [Olavius algarvensis Gamma 1 endosymbiont]|nr:MAG: hypothetical protein [Olavius algarvensis Gamma 1 endosymbiont]